MTNNKFLSYIILLSVIIVSILAIDYYAEQFIEKIQPCYSNPYDADDDEVDKICFKNILNCDYDNIQRMPGYIKEIFHLKHLFSARHIFITFLLIFSVFCLLACLPKKLTGCIYGALFRKKYFVRKEYLLVSVMLILISISLIYVRASEVGNVTFGQSIRIGGYIIGLENKYTTVRTLLENRVISVFAGAIIASILYIPAYAALNRTVFSIFASDVMLSVIHMLLIYFFARRYYGSIPALFSVLLFTFAPVALAVYDAAFFVQQVNIGILIIISLWLTIEKSALNTPKGIVYFYAFLIITLAGIFYNLVLLPFGIIFIMVWLYDAIKTGRTKLYLYSFSALCGLGYVFYTAYRFSKISGIVGGDLIFSDVFLRWSPERIKHIIFSFDYNLKYYLRQGLTNELPEWFNDLLYIVAIMVLLHEFVIFLNRRMPRRVDRLIFLTTGGYLAMLAVLCFFARLYDMFPVYFLIFIIIAKYTAVNISGEHVKLKQSFAITISLSLIISCCVNLRLSEPINPVILFKIKPYNFQQQPYIEFYFDNLFTYEWEYSREKLWSSQFGRSKNPEKDKELISLIGGREFKQLRVEFSDPKYLKKIIDRTSEKSIKIIELGRYCTMRAPERTSFLSAVYHTNADRLKKHLFYEGIAYELIINQHLAGALGFVKHDIFRSIPDRYKHYFFILLGERIRHAYKDDKAKRDEILHQITDEKWKYYFLLGFQRRASKNLKIGFRRDYLRYFHEELEQKKYLHILPDAPEIPKDRIYECGFLTSIYVLGDFSDPKVTEILALIPEVEKQEFTRGFRRGIIYRYGEDKSLTAVLYRKTINLTLSLKNEPFSSLGFLV